MSDRRFAIVGVGAVGGYYGAALARAGHRVQFLCRTGSEAARLRQRGVSVISPRGNFETGPVAAAHAIDDMPACDVVIVALKTTRNHLLAGLLPPLVRPGGSVLMLQNGLGAEEQADAALGGRGDVSILGGLCFVCTGKAGPGRIEHQDYGLVTVGEYRRDGQPAGVTAAAEAVVRDWAPTGIPCELAEDLPLARWKKLVWNVPFNGLSVVVNATTDVLISDPGHLAHVQALMAEVQAGCRAVTGRAIDDAHVQKMIDNTRRMTPYLPSMKLDFDAGRPLEIEAIFGEPVRRAEAAGCRVPAMRALWSQLAAMSR